MPSPDPLQALATGDEAKKPKKAAAAKKAAAEPAPKADDAQTENAGEAPETVTENVAEEPDSDTAIVEAAIVEAIDDRTDAERALDNRLERLTRIVEDAEFESGTALGDLVECMVDVAKNRPAWGTLDSNQQRDLVRHFEAVGRKMLAKVVLVIAQEDSLTVEGTLLSQFNVKGEVLECKIKVEHIDAEGLLDVYNLAGHKVILISADDKRFASKRGEIQTPGNQPALPFADGEKAKPGAPIESKVPGAPAGDSDLADEDDDEEVEEAETDATRTHGDHSAVDDESTELFGVFDEERGEWLVDEQGGDDGWTDSAKDAGRWPHSEATGLARKFDAPGEPPLRVRLMETPDAVVEPAPEGGEG